MNGPSNEQTQKTFYFVCIGLCLSGPRVHFFQAPHFSTAISQTTERGQFFNLSWHILFMSVPFHLLHETRYSLCIFRNIFLVQSPSCDSNLVFSMFPFLEWNKNRWVIFCRPSVCHLRQSVCVSSPNLHTYILCVRRCLFQINLRRTSSTASRGDHRTMTCTCKFWQVLLSHRVNLRALKAIHTTWRLEVDNNTIDSSLQPIQECRVGSSSRI